MVGNNLLKFFSGGGVRREQRDTRRAWDECQALWKASPLGDKELFDLALAMVTQAVDRFGRTPSLPFWSAATAAIEELLHREGIDAFEPRWHAIESSVELAIEFRAAIVHRRRWAADFSHVFTEFERIVVSALVSLLEELPEACFQSHKVTGDHFEVLLLDLLDRPAEAIEKLFTLPYDDASFRLDLFKRLRELCAGNMLEASGLPRTADPRQHTNRLVGPVRNTKITDASELAEVYLQGSPLKPILEWPIPFEIPQEVRFEHCHIIGGTGHGKTQLMQKMIYADLLAAQKDGRAVVVIDSQGDLINTLVRLSCFAPDEPNSLAGRLVLIDPEDIEYPAALNMFDAHLERTAEYTPVDRERVQNGAIELYEYFFEALLGAELTQKQGVIFKYLARLMLTIPQATIHTLMQVMEDGNAFRPYMKALPGSARHFFETEFFHASFSATKKQIVRRLWGVLATPAFERMFSHPENKVDLFEALNEGKIILINTSKDLLKQEGSSLFGRFFIAMLMQAALERSTIPANKRVPAFVYIDEAQEYFDENIATILNQARKYRVGLTLAHQNLDQLGPSLRAAILANASFKCVGGVSARDARTLAPELHTEPEFIERMRKRGDQTEFAAWVKGVTGGAIKLTVPLGAVARLPKISESQLDLLYERNQDKYCAPFEPIPANVVEVQVATPSPEPLSESPETTPEQNEKQSRPAPKPSPAPQQMPSTDHVAPTRLTSPKIELPKMDDAPGKGGKKHRYLQSLVKQLGEQHGFKAVIEAPIGNNEGQIDVLLTRRDLSIAFEVSVTTSLAHEIENAKKCLVSGAGRVVLVVARPRSLSRCKSMIAASFSSQEQQRIEVLSPEDISTFISGYSEVPHTTENIVRGYRVVRRLKASEPEDVRGRAEVLTKIIARSLKRLDESK